MKRAPFLLLVVSLACNGRDEAAAPRPRAAATPAANPEAAQGQQLIRQYGCNVCHVVPGIDGAQGSLGPSLAGIASRPTLSEAAVPNTPANLAQFVQNPASLNPQTSMPPVGISDDESRAIAAYLMTLK
ncbi:MAG TPA: c-type cytochrome [Thermoanaerobaculia bacterium]|jgi:cytochrome c2